MVPLEAPPSFRGTAIKYSYKVTIGTQRFHHPTKLLRVPFRVLVVPGKLRAFGLCWLCNFHKFEQKSCVPSSWSMLGPMFLLGSLCFSICDILCCVPRYEWSHSLRQRRWHQTKQSIRGRFTKTAHSFGSSTWSFANNYLQERAKWVQILWSLSLNVGNVKSVVVFWQMILLSAPNLQFVVMVLWLSFFQIFTTSPIHMGKLHDFVCSNKHTG